MMGGVETKHGSFSAWGFLSGEILVKTTARIHARKFQERSMYGRRETHTGTERKKERNRAREEIEGAGTPDNGKKRGRFRTKE
jgi:hypothetical protein